MRLSLTALALPLASALTITSIRSSGRACPSASALDITATDSLPVLTISIPDFAATADARNSSSCELGLTIEDGEAGRALVLESMEVWGTLGLSSGARGKLLTAAYWSEDADDLQLSQQDTSATRSFSDYVLIPSSFDLASACTDSDGGVGILNVSFRVVADEGEVTFGPHEDGGTTVAVSEHLGLRWDDC